MNWICTCVKCILLRFISLVSRAQHSGVHSVDNFPSTYTHITYRVINQCKASWDTQNIDYLFNTRPLITPFQIQSVGFFVATFFSISTLSARINAFVKYGRFNGTVSMHSHKTHSTSEKRKQEIRKEMNEKNTLLENEHVSICVSGSIE